ncbi:MAG TPA: hypothetical protein VFT98_10305 [Myxococcota bacterium]|nr:hypothetical protein [Myxococcota bacterium]
MKEALRRHLDSSRRRGERYRYEPLTKRGRVVPGVDLTERDSLHEHMGRS